MMAATIIVGTVAIAIVAATVRNNAIEPLSRADAPVTFVADVNDLEDPQGNLLEIVQAQVDDARERAISVNVELLADPNNDIQADPTLGRLTFTARSPDPERAAATAAEMRRNFITHQPANLEDQINAQLDTLSAQMEEVRQEIEVLDAETALPREVAARRDRLSTLLANLEQQALDLERAQLVPLSEEGASTPEEVSTQLAEVNAAIAQVLEELDTIPAPPEEFSAELTQRRALERRYRELEASFQDLLLQRSEVSGEPITETVDVFDETPDLVPRRTAAMTAFLLGGGLALVVLLLTERVRRPVWLPSDVPDVQFLATIPLRSLGPLPWYLQTGESERKAAIQSLRSSVRARRRDGDVVVGVAGAGIDRSALLALGADLALAFASTRSATSLIDAVFEPHPSMPEYAGHTLSLGDVASQGPTSDQIQAMIEDAIGQHDSVHAELITIASGENVAVPADAVAGPQIGHLFDALREIQDVVVVVCDDIDSAATRATLDRTDLALLVTAPGATTQATIKRVVDEMAIRRIDLAGVMMRRPMLTRTRRTLGWLRSAVHRLATSDEERAFDWRRLLPDLRRGLSRSDSPAGSEGIPLATDARDETARSILFSDDGDPIAPIVTVVGPKSASDQGFLVANHDPGHVLRQLEEWDPADAIRAAEDFMVSWVTKVIEARPDTGLTPATVREVEVAGFVPLSTWKGNPSLGSRLRTEFRAILGKREAGRLEEVLLKALGFGHDPSECTSMDRWVSRRYFEAHAVETGWEPVVWHITSAHGTVAALIAADRLTSSRIERFVDTVVIRAIERLARRQRRKEMVGDQDASEFETQIEEVRGLGLALAWLMDGSHQDSRLWYPGIAQDQQPRGWNPDWGQGVKSNIAPLQRLGVLAVPVLTEKELEILDPTG